jgi:hypothetical protein
MPIPCQKRTLTVSAPQNLRAQQANRKMYAWSQDAAVLTDVENEINILLTALAVIILHLSCQLHKSHLHQKGLPLFSQEVLEVVTSLRPTRYT